MVSLERMLFDYNEYLHHIGILAADKYITSYKFMMSIFVTLILMMLFMHYVYPVVQEMRIDKKVSETILKYFFIGSITLILSSFMIGEQYGLLLGIIIISCILYIIFTDKRLISIREFIETLF